MQVFFFLNEKGNYPRFTWGNPGAEIEENRGKKNWGQGLLCCKNDKNIKVKKDSVGTQSKKK
jgi:hypothetical protein